MPTKKQLNSQLEADFEFGRGNDRGSEHTPIGEQPPTGIPDIIRKHRENPKGELLGYLVWDEEAQEMRFKHKED